MIATVEADATPPRVKIETTAAAVTRVLNGVRTPVRGVVVAGVIYDYECPQETPVTYDDGLAVSAAVEIPDVGDWLVHLATPSLSCQVTMRQHQRWSSPILGDQVDIPGGSTVSVTFGRRLSDRGEFLITTYDRDEYNAVRALLDDGSILFLSTPTEIGFGPAYLSVGAVDWERRVNWSGDAGRIATLPYVEVARPAFITDAGLSWSNLPSTWGALASTWDALEGV